MHGVSHIAALQQILYLPLCRVQHCDSPLQAQLILHTVHNIYPGTSKLLDIKQSDALLLFSSSPLMHVCTP